MYTASRWQEGKTVTIKALSHKHQQSKYKPVVTPLCTLPPGKTERQNCDTKTNNQSCVPQTPTIKDVCHINTNNQSFITQTPTIKDVCYINTNNQSFITQTPTIKDVCHINTNYQSCVTRTPTIKDVSHKNQLSQLHHANTNNQNTNQLQHPCVCLQVGQEGKTMAHKHQLSTSTGSRLRHFTDVHNQKGQNMNIEFVFTEKDFPVFAN